MLPVAKVQSKLTDHKFKRAVAVFFVAHLLAGLLGQDFELTADGVEYVRMAENMLAGAGFTFDGQNPVIGKTPGTSTLIAAHQAVAGSLIGFHTLQLIVLFLGFVAVMVFTRRVLGDIPALGVLGGLVLLQPIRDLAANALSEPLFIASFTWGLTLLQRSFLDREWRSAVLAGIVFGVASYTRPVGFFWPLALVPAVYLVCRDRLPLASVTLLAYIVVVSPWMARSYALFGRVVPMASNWGPMLTMTEEQLWRDFSRTGTKDVYQSPHFVQAAREGFLFNFAPQEVLRRATFEGWRRDPIGTFWRCAKQSAFVWSYCPGTKEWNWNHPYAFWLGRAAMVSFLLVSVVGLIMLWHEDKLSSLLIGGQVVYAAAIMFPVSSESRYLVPSYLALFPATAGGVVHILRLCRGSMRWSLTYPRRASNP